ncbi:MAG: UDP-N-acetylmuramate dehydrogenase [bacterium]|nr:UDP-N-acetylmuramate dehydrogenase [bacterium]
MKTIKDFSLRNASYIKIGGESLVLFAENHDDLKEAFSMKNPKILGAMSNILFAAQAYDSTFISLSGDFETIELISQTEVRAGAGVRLSSLLSFLKKNLLSGFEELAGIPGSLGGMLFMNAGANGKCISDNLTEFEALFSGAVKKKDKIFSYRHSSINEPIEFLTFEFEKSSKEIIEEKTKNILERRKLSQPLDKFSLGSVFKNPSSEHPAWKLIKEAGMSGKCVNSVCVSTKHANFIINEGDGTGEDFLTLSETVREKVNEKFKIKLEYEIEILK